MTTEDLKKLETEQVLMEVKELVQAGKVQFQDSKKNIETMRKLRRELGITYDDFKNEVLDTIQELEIKNYYQGPDLDDNPERDLIFWKFGVIIFDIEIYLKFDIREIDGKKVILWSYHIPEYPIIYPFK